MTENDSGPLPRNTGRGDQTLFRLAVSALVVTLSILNGCGDAPPPPVPRVPAASVAGNGTITGRVAFDGPAPERTTVRNEPCCPGAPATLQSENVIVNANGTLANVFVYLEGGPKTDGSSLPAPTLDQKFCQYVPHALGVVVGQTLKLHSSDATMHNVRITPERGPVVNEYMTGENQTKDTKFAAPGFAVSKCDVHPWMTAHVGVFDNPFFALTGPDGTYTITGVPDGTYTLVARHEQYGPLPGVPVTVKDGRATGATDFSYHPPAP